MPKRQFEVGSRVRIRDWDDMLQEFGTLAGDPTIINVPGRFLHGMRGMCGQEATIAAIYPTRCDGKDAFAVRLVDWSGSFNNGRVIVSVLTVDMIELATPVAEAQLLKKHFDLAADPCGPQISKTSLVECVLGRPLVQLQTLACAEAPLMEVTEEDMQLLAMHGHLGRPVESRFVDGVDKMRDVQVFMQEHQLARRNLLQSQRDYPPLLRQLLPFLRVDDTGKGHARIVLDLMLAKDHPEIVAVIKSKDAAKPLSQEG